MLSQNAKFSLFALIGNVNIVAPLGYLERSSTKPTLVTGVGSLPDFSQQIIQVALVVALRDNDFGAKVKGTVQSNSTVIRILYQYFSA